MNVFEDQARFMRACGQTVLTDNPAQAEMYLRLIDEELEELHDALACGSRVEAFDAAVDLMVVVLGYGFSRGFPMDAGWAEVIRSNMSKVDPATGVVTRRADGKILKGPNFFPPNLREILEQTDA